MKITIITVCYNSEKTIEQTLQSVLSQGCEDLEYIVVDGKSKDSTINIVERYKSGIAKFLSEPDKGIYDAMNKALAMATGEVIGILNSDDFYQDNEVLKEVVSHFDADPDLDILYGNLVYVDDEDLEKVVRKWESFPYYSRFFDDGYSPPHPTLFLRSRVYQRAGLFEPKYKTAADYVFMLRLFKKYSFKSLYVDRWMVRMRMGGASNKSIRNVLEANREIIRGWKDNGLKAPLFFLIIKSYKRLKQFWKK